MLNYGTQPEALGSLTVAQRSTPILGLRALTTLRVLKRAATSCRNHGLLGDGGHNAQTNVRRPRKFDQLRQGA